MHEILKYLYSLERFGIKLGLEVMQKLTKALGHPERKFKSIHIAGTNGKGSTAAFLASILQEAGYKTGLYTSPHLVRFNERIKSNGRDISDREILALTEFIKKTAEENDLQPTFFEFTTALAFLHFARKKVDFAVIETGMGGRLDATNVITPEISIITSIGLEHTQYLGNTLLKIAAEKAGIIKKGVPAIIAEENPRLIRFFRKACTQKKATVHMLDKEIHYSRERWGLDGQSFSASFMTGKNPGAGGAVKSLFYIPLLGQHQLRNAAAAMLAASYLGMPLEKIRAGLAKTYWPGRLEVIRRKPLIIVDGAHNAAGMRTVRDFLNSLPQPLPPKVLLLGIAKDKAIEEMVSCIAPGAKSIIISQGNYKPADMDVIERACRKHSAAGSAVKILRIADVKEAIIKALEETGKDGLLLVTGSLYFVGDVLKHRRLLSDFRPRW